MLASVVQPFIYLKMKVKLLFPGPALTACANGKTPQKTGGAEVPCEDCGTVAPGSHHPTWGQAAVSIQCGVGVPALRPPNKDQTSPPH